MFGRIIQIIRLSLPFVLNALLFKVIYNSNKGHDYALTDSLFYVGIFSLLYGVATIMIIKRESNILAWKPRNTGINIALSEQQIKNHHSGKKTYIPDISITTTHIKLLYIIIGFLLCISSAIVYFI